MEPEDIRKHEASIKLADSIERLYNNADFKALLNHINGVHQTGLVANISAIVKRGESPNTVYEELKAISFFNLYLNEAMNAGNYARQVIDHED